MGEAEVLQSVGHLPALRGSIVTNQVVLVDVSLMPERADMQKGGGLSLPETYRLPPSANQFVASALRQMGSLGDGSHS